MKRIAMLLIWFSSMTIAWGMLYVPPDEWYAKLPGGKYGVVSCHTEWSVVLIGPFSFTTHWGFETTRLIYFEILPILLVGTIVGCILFFRKRKAAKTSIESSRKQCWIRQNWDYLLLAMAILGGITTCTWLPDVLEWRQQLINEKLYAAIVDDDLEHIKIYISEKNINSTLVIHQKNDWDIHQPAPLILAASKGNIRLVEFFLSLGADIKKTYSDKYSVLHMACRAPKNKQFIIKYLIQHGANVNAQDFWQRSVLFSAVEDCIETEIIKLLLENGANVNIVDNGKQSPLDVANSDEVKKLLISYGAKSGKELSQSLSTERKK